MDVLAKTNKKKRRKICYSLLNAILNHLFLNLNLNCVKDMKLMRLKNLIVLALNKIILKKIN